MKGTLGKEAMIYNPKAIGLAKPNRFELPRMDESWNIRVSTKRYADGLQINVGVDTPELSHGRHSISSNWLREPRITSLSSRMLRGVCDQDSHHSVISAPSSISSSTLSRH